MANKKSKPQNSPTKEVVDKFILLLPMLESLLQEIREFSKKKPDSPLSKLRVNVINRVLKDIKDILGADPSINYLDILDEDTLPQNGDATLILGQYKAAMIQFKEKHYDHHSKYGWGWNLDDGFFPDK